MKLTKKPSGVAWPAIHYVYIEKIGPFQKAAPAAWNKLHEMVPAISEKNKVTGYTSLYKFKPKMTYRAGVSVAAKPKTLPKGMKYEKFKGGKYARFVLTGPYSDLPEACSYVFNQYVPEKKIKLRDDWCIENYMNDPRITPEGKLITQILIPV
jgi:DNA gyrase inhibitor GyrI